MDWLDRISIWAIVILIIGSFALISGHMGEARPERNTPQRTLSPEVAASREVAAQVTLIRNIMEAGNLGKAEPMAKELIQKHPYEGEARMVLGDIYMRKQQAVRGVLEYREAIDLNPDYLDKKTPLFQGKKLKVAVREALTEIEEGLRRNPADESLKKGRKALYYLQRRIAGSCS
jgi:tetratricopeptide (TPR) repeat protein